MEFIREGNLKDFMNENLKKGVTTMPRDLEVYAAHLVMGLKYLHEQNILHRDLKPDNILVDASGFLKITDFGLSRVVNSAEKKGLSPGLLAEEGLVGTPDYMAVELIEEKTEITSAVDWWSLGCILFEMLWGYPPFNDLSVDRVFENIRRYKIEWNYKDKIANPERYNLIMSLLHPDPTQRLGANGAAEIMNHSFFKNIDWDHLNKEVSPHMKKVRDRQTLSSKNNSVVNSNKKCFAFFTMETKNLKSTNSSIKPEKMLLSEYVEKELNLLEINDTKVKKHNKGFTVQPFVKKENLKRLNLQSFEKKFQNVEISNSHLKRLLMILKTNCFIVNYFVNYDFIFDFKIKA
jgi:serine/threonine protein kinase